MNDKGIPRHDLVILKLADRSYIDPVPLDQGRLPQSYSEGKKLRTILLRHRLKRIFTHSFIHPITLNREDIMGNRYGKEKLQIRIKTNL